VPVRGPRDTGLILARIVCAALPPVKETPVA